MRGVKRGRAKNWKEKKLRLTKRDKYNEDLKAITFKKIHRNIDGQDR